MDAEVQEIRADKKREARFMKEHIELRRQLRKSEEAGRDKTVLNMIKSLESQGMPKAQVVKTIAIAESLSAEEAQKYYEQLLVTEQ